MTSIVGMPANSSQLPIAASVDMRRQRPVTLPWIAGGESADPSTPIGAFHRNRKVIYLSDASASNALEDVPANQFHCAFSKTSSLYCDGDKNQRLDRVNLTKQAR